MSTGVSRWLVAGVFALLLGILGMHAFGLHGMAADHTNVAHPQISGAPAAPGVDAAAAPGVDAAAIGAPMVEASMVDPVADHSPAAEGGNPQGLHTMVGLCLTILAAGLLVLGSLVARNAPHRWMSLAPRVSSTGSTNRHTGCPDNGPPHVWAFSVIRC